MICRRSLLMPDSGRGFLAIVEKWSGSVIQKRRVHMKQGCWPGVVLPAQKGGALESVLAAVGFGPMAYREEFVSIQLEERISCME